MVSKAVPLTLSLPEPVAVKDMAPGTYFVPESPAEWPGPWQKAAENTLDHPPGTYVSVYLGRANGASGCHPTYRDGAFRGHALTAAQAIALLAAQS